VFRNASEINYPISINWLFNCKNEQLAISGLFTYRFSGLERDMSAPPMLRRGMAHFPLPHGWYSVSDSLLKNAAEFVDKLMEIDEELCIQWSCPELVLAIMEAVKQIGYRACLTQQAE